MLQIRKNAIDTEMIDVVTVERDIHWAVMHTDTLDELKSIAKSSHDLMEAIHNGDGVFLAAIDKDGRLL